MFNRSVSIINEDWVQRVDYLWGISIKLDDDIHQSVEVDTIQCTVLLLLSWWHISGTKLFFLLWLNTKGHWIGRQIVPRKRSESSSFAIWHTMFIFVQTRSRVNPLHMSTLIELCGSWMMNNFYWNGASLLSIRVHQELNKLIDNKISSWLCVVHVLHYVIHRCIGENQALVRYWLGFLVT